MYAFFVDFIELFKYGQIQYFLVFFLIIWLRWFIVNSFALKYRPCLRPFTVTKSVIIPVVEESPEVFQEVLSRITKQRPSQIIVVLNGPYDKHLRQVCNGFKQVDFHWTKKAGKRNAIRLGMKFVTSEIVVLVDSDTFLANKALSELTKPFRNPEVGGVTTRQRIIEPTKTLRSRFSEWLELIRDYGGMQAMSVTGKVGCLPGRAIAFRTSLVNSAMPQFINESFLGFHKEVSDDRALTNFALRAGYQTVLQTTAIVYTQAPETWRKFFRQQLRWAEGSQYYNLKMTGWMFKNAKLMFFIFWSDILIPFILISLYLSYLVNYWFYPAHLNLDLTILHQALWLVLLLTISGAYLSYTIRQIPALHEQKSHLIFLPLYIVFLSLIMAPIKILGFSRLADNSSWGTRSLGYGGSVSKGASNA